MIVTDGSLLSEFGSVPLFVAAMTKVRSVDGHSLGKTARMATRKDKSDGDVAQTLGKKTCEIWRRYPTPGCFSEVLILRDFKSLFPEVLILGDFNSFAPEVLILAKLKS